jgi:ribosomal protein S18 acetylase RimI-like enzyme
MDARRATAADVETVTECITLAFATDPIWSVALRGPDGPDPDHLGPYWRLFVAHAVKLGSVSIADEGAAVSVWVPPGEDELDEAGMSSLADWIGHSLDGGTGRALEELYGRFEASRAACPSEHHYLSLLATHPDHRGRGIGQQLLADDLARRDATGIPCYLESTNPGNDHRYARLGFRPMGTFRAVRDAAPISAMWRPAPDASA